MPIYTVKPGDTLTTIALHHGISSWQTLYNDPANKDFRVKRPNPYLIVPGDQINIPTLGPVADYRMAIIDGTGPRDEREYNPAMQNSFCRQLETNLGGKAKYIRGPGPFGMDVRSEAREAHDFLYANRKNGVKLMLAGYSRGGSAAIMAAESLEKNGIPVDSMFLFDSVARHRFSGGDVIPANVQFSRHARRDLNAYLIVKYEGTLADESWLPNASNPMRPTFLNTGLTWRGDGDHERAKPFGGSHGALGGVGWSFVREDIGCQMQVAFWMNKHLQDRGVEAKLRSLGVAEIREAAIPTATAFLSGLAVDALFMAKHEKLLSRAGRVP